MTDKLTESGSTNLNEAGTKELSPSVCALTIAAALVAFFILPCYLITKSLKLTVIFLAVILAIFSLFLIPMSLPWTIALVRGVKLSTSFTDVWFSIGSSTWSDPAAALDLYFASLVEAFTGQKSDSALEQQNSDKGQ